MVVCHLVVHFVSEYFIIRPSGLCVCVFVFLSVNYCRDSTTINRNHKKQTNSNRNQIHNPENVFALFIKMFWPVFRLTSLVHWFSQCIIICCPKNRIHILDKLSVICRHECEFNKQMSYNLMTNDFDAKRFKNEKRDNSKRTTTTTECTHSWMKPSPQAKLLLCVFI